MLLAVDTSTLWIGLALYDESQVLAETIWHTENHHTIELVPSIDNLLRRCKVTPADLQVLAVATGPGSFTSLRISLAVGWYEPSDSGWKSVTTPKLTTVEDLAAEIKKPTLVCGELTNDERQVLARKWKNVTIASPARSVRRPSFLGEIAWARWKAGQVSDPATLAPIYLHIAGEIPG
jgi:tRNA threonylcarbamoyladenosine biosynthesis protein TsaB